MTSKTEGVANRYFHGEFTGLIWDIIQITFWVRRLIMHGRWNDVVSNCSHHTAPFSTKFRDDSYAIVSYIPEDTILGISKLQRIVDWVARRGHLQEGLTQMIYDEVSKAAETKSVMVFLSNVVHTCESLRGAQSSDGSFTSIYFGGAFESEDLRREILTSIK